MAGSFTVSPLSREHLLSGGLWAFGGKAATALTGLASNVLLARLLSPQDLGAYFLAFSVVSFGAVLGSLGLGQTVVRLVGESVGTERFGRARRVVGIVASLGLLGACAAGGCYLLFGATIGSRLFHSPTLAAITGLVSAWLLVTTLQRVQAETFRGLHDVRSAALFGGLMTGALLCAGLSSLWLVSGGATLPAIVTLAVVSGLANALLSGWLLRRKVTALPPQSTKDEIGVGEVLGVAWPLLVANLVSAALVSADIWVLGAFGTQEEVAVYGAAARLMNVVAMPLMMVNAVVPPFIAGMYASGRRAGLERLLRSTSTLAGAPAFVLLAGFILLGGPVLGLVYGDYYRAGAAVLAVLSAGRLVGVWAGSCGMTLIMTGHGTLMMAITTVCGALTIVAALGAVDEYGPLGMAAAVSAGFALQNVLWWICARIATGIWTHASFASFTSLPELLRSLWTEQRR